MDRRAIEEIHVKSKPITHPQIGKLYLVPKEVSIYDVNGDRHFQPLQNYVALMVGHQAVCFVVCIKLFRLDRNKHVYVNPEHKFLWYSYEAEVENGNE